jgi:hypothetical protein
LHIIWQHTCRITTFYKRQKPWIRINVGRSASGDELTFQKACMEVVDHFRSGKITEVVAYGRLFALVTKQLPEKEPDEPEFTAASEAYSSLIKEHADKRAAANTSINGTSGSAGAGPRPDEPSNPTGSG